MVPGFVMDARKKEMKKRTIATFVMTDNEIIMLNRSRCVCNSELLRFDVNAKLNRIQVRTQKIPRPITNAFIFHPQ